MHGNPVIAKPPLAPGRHSVAAAPRACASASISLASNLSPRIATNKSPCATLRVSRETPDTLPPCGGPLVPGFLAELAARRGALREYIAREPAQRTSAYFSQLERIDAAGFLDEYVWHYLRNQSRDTLPPADLDMPAFETFRQRELPAHAVITGARVRVNTVRALPLDPQP